ncbi:hypothetical protein C7271_19845, partial [filamentous cyanobacterium CCP5]
MAQPDDPSNILRPPFRRQPSEAAAPSRYGINPGAAPTSSGGDPRLDGIPPEAGRPETGRLDPRRSQWRQQQQIAPTLGLSPQITPESPVPQPRSRPALQLPQPSARPSQSSPPRQAQPESQPQARYPMADAGAEVGASRPAQPPSPAARLGVRPPEIRLKYAPRGGQPVSRNGAQDTGSGPERLARSRPRRSPASARNLTSPPAAKVAELPVSRPSAGRSRSPRPRDPETPRKRPKPAP